MGTLAEKDIEMVAASDPGPVQRARSWHLRWYAEQAWGLLAAAADRRAPVKAPAVMPADEYDWEPAGWFPPADANEFARRAGSTALPLRSSMRWAPSPRRWPRRPTSTTGTRISWTGTRNPARTSEGLAAARGRPTVVNAEIIRAARDMLPNPAASVASIAKLLGVSPDTLYNHIPDLQDLRDGGRKALLPAPVN